MESLLRILIDSNTLNSDINFINDYTGKIIYSLVSCPLFIYDSYKKKHIKYACKRYYFYKEKNIYKFILRKDLKWSNGEIVKTEDFYNSFVRIIRESKGLDYGLLNIFNCLEFINGKCDCSALGIKFDDVSITIKLKSIDKTFLKLLSNLRFSPIKYIGENKINKNISAGKYFLYKSNDVSYTLKKNDFFFEREKVSFDLVKYFIEKNPYKGLELFNKRKIDITCNTIFPFKEINSYKNRKDYKETLGTIDVSIIINKNIDYDKRNILYTLINPYEINEFFNNVFCMNHDIKLMSKHYYNKSISSLISSIKNKNESFEINIGYDNFYPNKLILNRIKNILESYGVKINLIEDDFYAPNKKNYDAKLILTDSVYRDKISSYETLGLMLIKNLKDKELLMSYIKLLNLYKKESKLRERYIILNKLRLILLDLRLIIPLFKLKNRYLIDENIKFYGYGRDYKFEIIKN